MKWFFKEHFYYCGKQRNPTHIKTSKIFIFLSQTFSSDLPPHAVSIYIQLYFSLITISPTQLSHKFTVYHQKRMEIRNTLGALRHWSRKCNLIATLSRGRNEVANTIQSRSMFYFLFTTPHTGRALNHTLFFNSLTLKRAGHHVATHSICVCVFIESDFTSSLHCLKMKMF